MQVHRGAVRVLDRRHAGDVIDVSVGQQDEPHVDIQIAHGPHELIRLVPGVDDDRFTRRLAAHDETVLVEGRHGADFKNHAATILST